MGVDVLMHMQFFIQKDLAVCHCVNGVDSFGTYPRCFFYR